MNVYQVRLRKPDGRPLLLYSREPLPPDLEAPVPEGARPAANPHLRWHPLRGEWVAYAGHRQERTFHPPPEWDPLAPSAPGAPTEVPDGPWEVAVFENRFPSLSPDAHDPPRLAVETRPAAGVCEGVVFTREREGSLGALPLERIELLFEVWGERTRELGSREGIAYVMPFENRGAEVGATLPHPHGQIYAYPVVPPVPALELERQRAHLERHGRGLLETLIDDEERDGRRMLYAGDACVAFVPVCARWPYEVWIAPRRATPSLNGLAPATRGDMARALKTVLLSYDALRGRPFPYLMVFHQAPTDGAAHPEAHLHIEITPPYRTPERLKYLAGTELGAGFFTMDALPEATAAELQVAGATLATVPR